MHAPVDLNHCLSFVNCQLRSGSSQALDSSRVTHPRAVTISREAGCGARIVADKLAELLQACSPKDAPPWTVFDRNLMERVLEDHHLPARIARFIPEDRMTELQDITQELLGLRPNSSTVIEQTTETILHLTELGSVILIGRAANVITAKLPDVFHVRLVAPLAQRIEHAREFYAMTPEQARVFCEHEDLGRRRYLKKYFKADIADPLLYHLTINTGLISYDEAARLIVKAAIANHSADSVRL